MPRRLTNPGQPRARGRSRPSARRTRLCQRRPNTSCVHRSRPELRRHEPFLIQRPPPETLRCCTCACEREIGNLRANLFAKAPAGHRVPVHKRTLKHGPRPLLLGRSWRARGSRSEWRRRAVSRQASAARTTKSGSTDLNSASSCCKITCFSAICSVVETQQLELEGRLPDQLKQGPLGHLARQALPHRPFGKWVVPYLSGKSGRARIAAYERTCIHLCFVYMYAQCAC